MKAISIKQPYASLIANGIKDIENRTWKLPEKYKGQRVLIHASAKPFEFDSVSQIFTAEQREVLPARPEDLAQLLSCHCGAIIGSVELVDCVINHPSIWAEKTQLIPVGKNYVACPKGQKPIYNWVLANPILFPEPIPAKGKLNFWDYPDADLCLKSPNGKHEYVLPSDTFDPPYCKHCYYGS